MATPVPRGLMSDPGGGEPLAEIDFYDGAYGPSILLILTGKESIAWLRMIFESISAAPVGTVIDLAELPQVRATGGLRNLVLSKAANEPRKRLVLEATGGFAWSCTSDEWRTMSLMLEPFAVRSGHQYLTSEGLDDALVEVSYGEDHAKRGRHQSTPSSPARD